MLHYYILMFALFSFIGWVFETIFCSLNDGFYQNRGFLYGPVCPIYGLGGMFIVVMADVAHMHGIAQNIKGWQLFLIGYIFSAILEYSVHYALEKKFHATWWDYKNMPLNLNGRICVPASTLFGLSYVFIFKVVYPWSQGVRAKMPETLMEMMAYIFMMAFAVDTAITVYTLKMFEHELNSMDEVVNTNMESLLKVLKERRELNADTEADAEAEDESIKESKKKMLLDMVKQRAAGVNEIAASAIKRVENFEYSAKVKMSIKTFVEEIKKKNPF